MSAKNDISILVKFISSQNKRSAYMSDTLARNLNLMKGIVLRHTGNGNSVTGPRMNAGAYIYRNSGMDTPGH